MGRYGRGQLVYLLGDRRVAAGRKVAAAARVAARQARQERAATLRLTVIEDVSTEGSDVDLVIEEDDVEAT